MNCKLHGNTTNHTGKKFGKLTVINFCGMKKYGKERRSYWKCLCECGNKIVVCSRDLSVGAVRSCGCNRSLMKMMEKNPNWKGKSVGYVALHSWIKRRIKKPICCEQCGVLDKLDLANKSNLYKREIDDWEWLCRRCHMNKDGRLKKLHTISHKYSKNKKKSNCIMSSCGRVSHAFKLCTHHYYLYKKYKNEELTPFEVKFGKSCFFCGKRKNIFSASSGSEGGRDSVCKCSIIGV